jgi:phosphate transport system substrate-binding protein
MRPNRKRIVILLFPLVFIGIALTGCGKTSEPATPTSGYITVRGSDQLFPMMMEQAYAFMDLYPKAKVLVLGGGSNPALAALFIDSAQVAYSTRPMTQDELQRAKEADFGVREYKICKDGIAIVVNPLNPVRRLTAEQVRAIFSGKVSNWSAVGGRSWTINVLIWGENAGTHSYFRDSVLKITSYAKRVQRFDDTESMIRRIAADQAAVGVFSMSMLYKSWSPLVEDTRVKALEIGLSAKGEFVAPDEATVHAGSYPFVRYVYLYTPNEPKGLDSGFITFIMSAAGQKMIAANGFVPITVPVKYTQDTL